MQASATPTLLGLAVMAMVSGAVMIGFGIPIKEFGIGNTLISSGTTAIVGGLVLLGLAAALRQLAGALESLKTSTRPHAFEGDGYAADVVAASRQAARGEPQHRAAMPDAEPRARAHAVRVAKPARALDDPYRGSSARLNEANAELPSKGVEVTDFAGHRRHEEPRSDPRQRARGPRNEEPAAELEQTEEFDAIWPTASAGANGVPRPAVADAPAPLARDPLVDHTRQPAILKSGVIDGMAYTVYADGAIEAELPQGVLRFASVEELRSYLVGKHPSVDEPQAASQG